MSGIHRDEIVKSIHASGRQIVIAAAGGGASLVGELLATPGASRSLLEAIVPYASTSLDDWLGGRPDQACSEPTARAMAMAAWRRAARLAPEADPAHLIGVSCTASLATDRVKRGPHRIFVATQTATCTNSFALVLAGPDRSRAQEERIAADLLLLALAKRCGVDAEDVQAELQIALQADETVVPRGAIADPAWMELLLSQRQWTLLRPRSVEASLDADCARPQGLLFPGAFNPLHAGHLQMAAIAESRFERSAAWEICVANVDKPMLDFVAIHDRVQTLRWADPARVILLTRAATFRDKARLFPESIFIIGVDTVVRIASPRYYEDDAGQRDAALREIASQGCRFLVFGRMHEGKFRTLEDVDLPDGLADLCEGISADEFREDVSSTMLRQRSGDAGDHGDPSGASVAET